jgi:hypothetical protein
MTQTTEQSDRNEPETTRRLGRRVLMLGAAAAGAGAAVSLVAGTDKAYAANGGDFILGESNIASATTEVATTFGDGLRGSTSQSGQNGVEGNDTSSGGGNGVRGTSQLGTGVYGAITGDSTGQSGVYGDDASTGSGGGYGVFGTSDSGTGVRGEGGLIGVQASGPVGVLATATQSYGVSATCVAPTGYVDEINTGDFVAGLIADCSTDDFIGGIGVCALGSSYGVLAVGNGGTSGITTYGGGVIGDSQAGPGVLGQSSEGTGAEGITIAKGAAGVSGNDASTEGGYGVYGVSAAGVALYGASTGGTALEVEGVTTFSRSGSATVAGTSGKSASSVVVTGVTLTSASQILATPQAHVAGTGIAGVVPDVSAGSFTIYLTKAIKVSLAIAWFIIDLPTNDGSGPRQPAAIRRPAALKA